MNVECELDLLIQSFSNSLVFNSIMPNTENGEMSILQLYIDITPYTSNTYTLSQYIYKL